MTRRRHGPSTVNPIPDAERTPVAPWEPPSFEPIQDLATEAEHCFSVCLYREPEFAWRFPTRSFNGRYLDHAERVKELFERNGWHLRIFADEAMLETALGLRMGSVYRVRSAPAFPFGQHLWRYFSVLIPHTTIRAHHFRGMDNLLVSENDLRLMMRLLDGGFDLLHAPYIRAKGGGIYTPVRGSCSVAGAGIESLAVHLRTMPHEYPGDWPEHWHSDELWLGRWFERERRRLRLLTMIDREMHQDWLDSLADQIRTGPPFEVVRVAR